MSNDPNMNATDLMGEVIERIDRMEDALEGQPIEDQIELGSLLWTVQERVKKSMETAKAEVREHAVEEIGGPGSQTFVGSDKSEATVTIPDPSPSLQKDADIDLLRKVMGGEFDRYFEEITTFKVKKEFHERRAAAKDPTHVALIDKYVDITPHTPRVAFKRMDR